MNRAPTVFLALVCFTGALGCALRRDEPDPVEQPITLLFPSEQAAVAVTYVEVQVFAGSEETTCLKLEQNRREGTAPPRPLLTQLNTICDYFSGSVRLPANADAGVLPVGGVTIVAVASLQAGATVGPEAFSGCVEQTLGSAPGTVLPITLSRSGEPETEVSAGSCPSLQALCVDETSECLAGPAPAE